LTINVVKLALPNKGQISIPKKPNSLKKGGVMKRTSFYLHVIAIYTVFTLLGLGTAAADTILVPLDFPTIQEAIDAAVDGDRVLVAPGTYVENINFLGKGITVTSEEGPEVTIIDGNQAGSVVTFDSGEGLASVLSGLTITNGQALYPGGGGILCNESSPTIINCKIVNNSSTVGGGGGISCWGSSSSPIITNCIISENSSIIGGGIFCYYSSPTISNCTIWLSTLLHP
jgi:hypothetical protein